MQIYPRLSLNHQLASGFEMNRIGLALLAMVIFIFGQSNTESDDFSYPLKLYNQEFFDLAAQQFIKFYNSYPNSAKIPDAKYYAGMSYFKLGEFSRARIEFQSAALEYPRSERAGECWFKTGECYERIENKAEAAKSYETIRLLYPDHPLAAEGVYKAAVLNLELGNSDKSQQLFRMILDRYNSSAYYFAAIVKLGGILYQIGELQKATDLLRKVLETKADETPQAEAYLFMAQISKSQGNISTAKNNYQKIINSFPGSEFASVAVLELSKILIQEGDLKTTQQLISSAISREKKAPRLRELHYLLGDAYFLDQKYGLALKEYEHPDINAVSPKERFILLKISMAKYRQKLVREALKDLRKVIDLIPEHEVSRNHLIFDLYIQWLSEVGDRESALRILAEHLTRTITPLEKVKFVVTMARLFAEEGRWAEIIQYLQPLILLPDTASERDDLIYYLALANEKIRNFQQSVYYYNLIITDYAASSYFDQAYERLSYLNSYKIVDKDLAVMKLAQVISSLIDRTDKSTLKFKLGLVYYTDLKDYFNAEKEFQEALEQTDISGDIHLYLGKTYLRLADLFESDTSRSSDYFNNANEQFKLAVANISTCSSPDEASWLRIKASMNMDTIQISRERKLIEALIKNYPESPLVEEWHKTLAYSLAFDPNYLSASLTHFKILIDNFSKSAFYPSYLYGYAKLIQEQDKEGALNLYKRIVAEFPNSGEAAIALSEVANFYASENKFAEASMLYKKLSTAYYYADITQENLKKLGYCLMQANENDEAINIINQQFDPIYLDDVVLTKEFLGLENSDNVYYLAKAYLNKGDLIAALKFNQLYLNLNYNGPYSDFARSDIGKIYYDKNQKEIALENFNSISNSNPVLYVQARLYMAEIYFEQGIYAKAASLFKDLLGLMEGDPKVAEVHGKYIVALIREGQFNEANPAIKQFKNKYSGQKNFQAEFLIEFGKYYREKKDYNSALKYFQQVKNDHKSSEYVDDAEYYLALVYLSQNRNEDAFKILSGFYNNYPKSNQLAAALNSLGTLYYRSEKYDAAIAMFKNALEACKERDLEKNILSNLIQTYSMTSFWDAAQAMSRQYVEKFPEAEDKIDKKIIVAQAYINQNQFENAIEYLRKIKFEADSEREPEIQFYIGEAYLKAGQYENAIAEFVKIPLLSKKTELQWEASALYYSGQSYEKLGRMDDAIRMYQEIVLRPGIDLVLKKEAEKRIKQLQ